MLQSGNENRASASNGENKTTIRAEYVAWKRVNVKLARSSGSVKRVRREDVPVLEKSTVNAKTSGRTEMPANRKAKARPPFERFAFQ